MKRKDKDKAKSRKRRKSILTGLLIIILIMCAAGAGIGIAVVKSAPSIDLNFYENLKQSAKLYDKSGNYIENLSDVEDRTVIPIKKIPKNLQNAFIAIEDERFKSHHGIDFKRIAGAIWYDIRTLSKAQGASTITQQLIKNTVLSPEKRFTRKLQEMYLALKIERMLSKDQILEAYLNTIYLGGNAYGVQSASMYYFGKEDLNDLTVGECALIAGLTQNPAKYWPYSKKNKENPENYMDRQRVVLRKMLELELINQDEYDKAYNEKLDFKTKESVSKMKYQWFIEPAVDQIAKDFSDKFGISESEAKQKLRTGGYSIYLTMDTKIQDKAEQVIENPAYYPAVPKSKQYYAKNSKDEKLIQPQAAAVIMDVTNGEVRAIVGGRGPHPLRSYNRATDTEVARQPGSAIKPLAVYSPALENKIASPSSVLEDSPMPQDFVNANDGWDPKNYDRKFRGYTTVRNAVKDSVNLVAIKLLKDVGVNTSIDFLKNKFHMTTIATQGSDNDKNLSSLALGGMTYGVTPLEMTAAYSTFANSGIYSEPILYTKVVDNKGSTILEKASTQSKALSPQSAFLMVNMMETVVKSGTGRKASLGNMPSAGKTGTSDEHTNGWYMGVTPYYSGAVWMGHDDKNVSISGLVGGTEAPMWRDIMIVAHKGLEVKSFPEPTGLVVAEVCLDSGKAPSELCSQDPRGSRIQSEIFIEGTEPVEICDIHTRTNIDSTTGKLATPATPVENVVSRVFIKRGIKSRAALMDDPYVVPTEFSDSNKLPPEDKEDGTEDTMGNGNAGGNTNNNVPPPQ